MKRLRGDMSDIFYNTELLRGGDVLDIDYSKERNAILSQLSEEENKFKKEELELKIEQIVFLGKVFDCLNKLKRSAKQTMRYVNEQFVLFQIQESLHAVETDKLIGYEGYYIDPVDGKKVQYKIISDYTVWSTSSADENMRENLWYEDGILLRREGKEILIDIEKMEDE